MYCLSKNIKSCLPWSFLRSYFYGNSVHKIKNLLFSLSCINSVTISPVTRTQERWGGISLPPDSFGKPVKRIWGWKLLQLEGASCKASTRSVSSPHQPSASLFAGLMEVRVRRVLSFSKCRSLGGNVHGASSLGLGALGFYLSLSSQRQSGIFVSRSCHLMYGDKTTG